MENHEDLTERQKFQAAKGKEVALDYFLYTCLEHERTQKSIEDAKIIQWEALEGQEEDNLKPPLSEGKLKELLREMTMWYRDNYPALSSTQKLDHEQLVEVVDPLTSFNRDISTLYRLKCGEDIPTFEGSVGNNMIWEDVSEVIGIFFESYQHLFSRYIIWSHSSNPEEVVIPGSRPPVGRHAPRFKDRPGNSGGRDRGGNDRGGRGGRDRGGNDRGGRGGRDRGGNTRHQGSGQQDTRGGRDLPGQKSQDRGGRGQDRGGRGRGRGRDNKPKHDAKETAKLEAIALKEVAEAIETLGADSSKDEVILKPNNSFYRRIQHQRAVELGFDSFSVGEGHDRSVRIARKEEE